MDLRRCLLDGVAVILRGVPTDVEINGGELNQVPFADRHGAADAMPIEKRAVGAVEITEKKLITDRHDFGVCFRNGGGGEAKSRVTRSPDTKGDGVDWDVLHPIALVNDSLQKPKLVVRGGQNFCRHDCLLY